ncbi:hypothetical protein J4E91_006111 [Alternaria rosae]|nr:hypothetical protein J4E91_006111 [Alternaria rosae]
MYVRPTDTAIDDPAQGEKLVKILMSIRKKKDFYLSIELVQEEVKLNLPVLAEYEREGGRIWFKWLCPWDKYDPIEFELNEALKDTSRSDKWRRDAREYLDGLDDYIIQDMHEANYDPKDYNYPSLNTPPDFYPESVYEDDSSADDASQDDAGEEDDSDADDSSEDDSSADDASEDGSNADDAIIRLPAEAFFRANDYSLDEDDKDKSVAVDSSEDGSGDDDSKERKLAESILGTEYIRKITGH